MELDAVSVKEGRVACRASYVLNNEAICVEDHCGDLQKKLIVVMMVCYGLTMLGSSMLLVVD